jgi:hypothetical protein
VIALEISSRNARVAALQKRWERLRPAWILIPDGRDADMADLPGGESGLLRRDYMGRHFPPTALALEISSRNSRVAPLQKRWDRLRAGLDPILDQRRADIADILAGASGLLVRDCRGKEPIG